MAAETNDPALNPPILGGRYVIVSRLGRGGAAGVYLAFDRTLGTWRAAKVLHARHAGDPELRARFLDEARTMARIDHPNVVRTVDVASAAVPYMIMEYVSGGCLIDWLRSHGPMPPVMVAQAMVDVCRALAATHQAGVVHRDVKPHNVLAASTGQCKLTDYGIAKVDEQVRPVQREGNVTQIGAVMGSTPFMAPEQRLDASSVDVRADVYGVGATMFALCTRRAVVDLWTLPEDDPQLAEIPAPLREVLCTSCAQDPNDRYGSAIELEQALNRVRLRLDPVPVGIPDLAAPAPPLPLRPTPQLDREVVATLVDLTATTDRSAEVDTPMPLRQTPPGAPATTPPGEPTPMPETVASNPAPADEATQPGSAPYVAEAIRVRPAEAEAEPVAPTDLRWVGQLAMVVVVLAGIVIAVGAAALWLRAEAGQVATARARVEAERTVLLDVLRKEHGVIAGLGELGAPTESLETAYFAFDDASGAARTDAARALVGALTDAFEALPADRQQAMGHGETEVSVRRIQAAAEGMNFATAAWDVERDDLGGTLAARVGLVEPAKP